MNLIPGGNWAAVILQQSSSEVDGPKSAYIAPVVAWTRCGDSIVGLILKDWTGQDLPYPVPAPNVFGFLRYIQVDDNGVEIPIKVAFGY